MNKVVDKVLAIDPNKSLTLLDFFPVIIYGSLGISLALAGLAWFFGKAWFQSYLDEKIKTKTNDARQAVEINIDQLEAELDKTLIVLKKVEDTVEQKFNSLKAEIKDLSHQIEARFVSTDYNDRERLRDVIAEINKSLEVKKDAILSSLLSMIEELREDIKYIDVEGSRYSLDLSARVKALEERHRKNG